MALVFAQLGPDHGATARPMPGLQLSDHRAEFPPQHREERRLCWASQALPVRALASWAPGTGGVAGPLDNGPRGRGWEWGGVRGESLVIAAWAAWEDEAVCAREAWVGVRGL